MRIAGIEISGGEAIFCILEYDRGLIEIVQTRTPKLALRESTVQGDMQFYHRAAKQFFLDYKVNEVVVRERPMRGKFAGSAASFKIEATLQLLQDFKVGIITNTTLKETLKRFPLAIDYAESGLKKYQRSAFDCAYARINGAATTNEVKLSEKTEDD